jgi:hypothetical protein
MQPKTAARITFCLAGFGVLAQAQQELKPETLQLARIKGTVEENLSRLPNYTCTETIQRSERPKIDGKAKLMVLETTRMEVAFVDGKELFGWPGAAKIDESNVGKMINGSIGNGYFGLFSSNIFSTPFATIQYVNAAELEGKPAVRYDYRVPQMSGAYVIKTDLGQVSVGFHGSFWVNPETLDLIRITAVIDDPPQGSGSLPATAFWILTAGRSAAQLSCFRKGRS